MHALLAKLDRGATARWSAAALVIAGLIGPILLIALARHDRSVGDIALIELRTRDVLSTHPPLTGAYSRYGWSHPGPLLFALFAVPFRILGSDSDALRLTTLLFNVAVVALITWVVAKRGTAALVSVTGAVIALVWGLHPHAMSEGWNVTVAILPFLLTIVACWGALCGDRWMLWVATLSFSFVFQAHIGFGLVLVPVLAFTLLWRAAHSGRRLPRVDRRSVLAAGSLIVVFLPVLYDSLAHWPGNLGRLARWWLRNDEPKVGLAEGLRIVGRAASLSFLSHPQVPGRFVLAIETVQTGVLPGVALLLLVGALVVAVRRRFVAERWLCICLLLVWAAGAFAAANLAEPLLPWLIDWLQPLGWLTWSTVVLVAWRTVQARVQGWPIWAIGVRVGASVVGVVFAVGTGLYAHHHATTPYLSAAAGPAVAELSRAARTVDDDQPVSLVYEGDPLSAGTMMNGVANELDRTGFLVCVDPTLANQFGSSRVCSIGSGPYLMVRSEDFASPPPDNATTLAISDPLTPQQRLEADSISSELASILVADGREDRVFLLYSPLADLVLADDPPPELIERADDVARLNELRQVPGTRYGLYLVGA